MPPAVPPNALRVHKTIGSTRPMDVCVGAVVQILCWGGGMVVGPLMWLGVLPVYFLFSARSASLLLLCAATLSFLPALPESPAFCRLFLRTASLVDGGCTLWVADKVLPHVGDGLMVCYHPHGVVPMGFSINGAVRAKARRPALYLPPEAQLGPHVSGVQAPVLFRVPLLRQMLQLFGCTVPATKQGVTRLLAKGMTFGIIVGGSEEVALHTRGRERLFLRNRAGFIKYALQFGYKLVIAYNFGESDLYDNVTQLQELNLWLVRRWGFVLPVFWGRYWWCPFLPRRGVALHTVLGEVLELPTIKEPTAEEVAEWHQKYIAALESLFNSYKDQFGYAERTLEIL